MNRTLAEPGADSVAAQLLLQSMLTIVPVRVSYVPTHMFRADSQALSGNFQNVEKNSSIVLKVGFQIVHKVFRAGAKDTACLHEGLTSLKNQSVQALQVLGEHVLCL